jgi:hypothetical protein
VVWEGEEGSVTARFIKKKTDIEYEHRSQSTSNTTVLCCGVALLYGGGMLSHIRRLGVQFHIPTNTDGALDQGFTWDGPRQSRMGACQQ